MAHTSLVSGAVISLMATVLMCIMMELLTQGSGKTICTTDKVKKIGSTVPVSREIMYEDASMVRELSIGKMVAPMSENSSRIKCMERASTRGAMAEAMLESGRTI